jgi:phage-related protein
VWVGPSRKELKAFPRPVQRAVGLALYAAQLGETPPDAKPLKGFGGAGVLELLEDHRGDTYRAVYTVRFATKIYVLHAFQKKSKHGIATPQKEIELIRARLKWAERLYAGKTTEG